MIVDEYLVKLGATVDQSGLARFHTALREASMVADANAVSIAGSFFKAQTEIVGGFAAIGGAALGLVDKVAMADQSYRLFALHMYMSKDAARGLKVAMDALGQPLENLTWDKELRDRTHQLLVDQQAMAPTGDFDAQMEKIRDIRFEFTRMEVELQYLGMHVVQDFLTALGVGPDTLLNKLRSFNDWVTHDLPQISQKMVAMFMPIWHDIEMVGDATWRAFKAASTAFTNLIGLLTGDSSIQGTTFDIQKLAGAVEHIVNGFANFATAIANVEEMIAHLVSALVLLFSGNFTGAGTELRNAFHSLGVQAVGGLAGGIAGGLAGSGGGALLGGALGSVFGPIGTTVGASIGGALGAVGGSTAGGFVGSNITGWGSGHYGPGASNGSSVDLVGDGSKSLAQQAALTAQKVSAATGIPADLVWSQWAFETNGFKHMGKDNNLAGIRLPGTKEYQSFDSVDAFGERYAEVVKNQRRYAGLSSASTPHEFASVLKGGGYYEGPEKDYEAGVARYQGMYRHMAADGAGTTTSNTIGSVTINVKQQPGESQEALAARIKTTLNASQNKKVQRNLAEFQDLSWST